MFVFFCRKMNELNEGIIECWDLTSNPKATKLSPQFGTKGEWWSKLYGTGSQTRSFQGE